MPFADEWLFLHIIFYSLKKFYNISSNIIDAILILLVILYGILHLPSVQNRLVKEATELLSKQLKTTVKIDHIDFSFFNEMDINGVLIKDHKNDTLLYTNALEVRISDWFFFKEKPVLHYIGLRDAFINLKRTDSVWNYQFLADIFSASDDSSSKNKNGTIQFDLKKVFLKNIRFYQLDSWYGRDMKLAIGTFSMNADDIDLKNKKIKLSTVSITEPVFKMNDYTGNKEKLHIVSNVQPEENLQSDISEKYQWNNDEWMIDLNSLSIDEGTLQIDRETDRKPYKNIFDEDHFIFNQIAGKFNHIHFEKDTITSKIQLSAKEKSGFKVNKLQANFKFDPLEMQFENLDILTNSSHLGNFYTMKYKNFNDDMSDFIHSVTLEGKFTNSVISSDDIAFFAPELKDWKRKFDIAGTAKGTIDHLSAKQMIIKSGKTKINGSIALIGLPDIYKTFIDFKSNELTTNYAEVISIVPALKKNK